MTIKVQVVPVHLVHQTWPLVEHYIADALKWGDDDCSPEQLKVHVAGGSCQLLIYVSETSICGAAVIRLFNNDNDRIAAFLAIGGKGISGVEEYNQVEQIVKNMGATRIQGVGRKSIVRLWSRLGFKEKYTLFDKKFKAP
jgi:hypothetical protein